MRAQNVQLIVALVARYMNQAIMPHSAQLTLQQNCTEITKFRYQNSLVNPQENTK